MRTSVSSLEPTEKPDIVSGTCLQSQCWGGKEKNTWTMLASQPRLISKPQVLVKDPVSGSKMDSS